VYEISETAERICGKFTRKMCLAPRSYEFEGDLRAVYVWKNMTCYASIPQTMPNFIDVGQTMYEKSVTIFYTPHFLGPQGPPGPKFTSLGSDVHQGHSLSRCQISSPSDNPSTRYLLSKFVDLVDRVIDRETKKTKKNCKRYRPRIPCGD